MTPGILDTRGLRCPWPVIRLARAVRSLDQGREEDWRIELIADDPVAITDVPAFCAEQGWAIDCRVAEGDLRHWLISRR